MGRYVMSWDILYLKRFILGRFEGVPLSMRKHSDTSNFHP